MKNLELQKCILGPVYTNCYILKNKETGELIIVDPADCPEKIEMKISRMNGKPVAILLTHGHFDHILAAQAVKATNLDNKWLPVICGVLGGILGVVGLYWIPEYPAQDIITAIAVGIMSGLAATGVNQVYKQLSGEKTEK